MIRVCVVCEGQTEVEFINQCLTPFALLSGVLVYPTLIRAPSGRHRGGRVTVERLVDLMALEFHHFDRVTCLVDFYGFKDRGVRTREALENAISEGLQSKKIRGFDKQFVLPYVQMYEFEGLLFTDPAKFEVVIDGWNDKRSLQIEAVRGAFNYLPETINDSPETAPSKRLNRIFDNGSYNKVEYGPLIAQAIGIAAIREACPNFDAWVSRILAWDATTT
jgi:hypothetical protein